MYRKIGAIAVNFSALKIVLWENLEEELSHSNGVSGKVFGSAHRVHLGFESK